MSGLSIVVDMSKIVNSKGRLGNKKKKYIHVYIYDNVNIILERI